MIELSPGPGSPQRFRGAARYVLQKHPKTSAGVSVEPETLLMSETEGFGLAEDDLGLFPLQRASGRDAGRLRALRWGQHPRTSGAIVAPLRVICDECVL